MPSLLKANSLGQSYKSKIIFKDFTYAFEMGKIYAFQGESGCGKSTMLSILAGYLKPQFGSISVNKKEVSFLSTDNNIFLNLTIEENLKTITDDEEEIKFALSKVNLYLPLDSIGRNLSKGEALRLAIARMILENKKILIFDEPTGNLDKENTKLIFELLYKIKKNHIIIISSHDTLFLKDYSDIIFTYSDCHFMANDISQITISESKKKNISKRKSIPVKTIFKFIYHLFKTNIKQNVILMILSSFLLFVLNLGLSFVKSDLNLYNYKVLSSNKINGVIISPIEKEESDLIADSLMIKFQNKDATYFAISNKNNKFNLNSFDITCKNENGIILPSNIANELDVKIDSKLFIDGIDEALVVEDIYQYQHDDKISNNLKEKLNLKDTSIILDYNYPIYVSYKLLTKYNISTVDNVYASPLLFMNNSTILSPAFLNNFDANTSQFWNTKKTYNETVYYLILAASILILITFEIWLFSSTRGFKNEIELIHYIYGSNRISNLILMIDEILKSSSSFIIALLVSIIVKSQMNVALASFFMIKPIIPILQDILIPSIFVLATIIIFNLISFITCALFTNKTFKNIINRK